MTAPPHFALQMPPMPATSLPARGQHLEARLLELERFHQERPGLPTALARTEVGEKIDAMLNEIAELKRMIETSPAENLEAAAVLPLVQARLGSRPGR